MKEDILIYLSDQHRGDFLGKENSILRTPNLDRIAEEGTTFTDCYSPCPFCVPARTSMLSTQLAMHTEVYTNHGAIRSDAATFLHSLAAEGYETVLCGRMHFEGPDQRHGFTKRIFGDILQLYPGQEDAYHELGEWRPTISEPGCSKIFGGGEHSPTLDYDRLVVEKALEYLDEPHEKPQCLVIGTYAPHFPFVGPTDLYRYYLEKLEANDNGDGEMNYHLDLLSKRYQVHDRSDVLKMRAAYYAMVENMDEQIGKVRKAWDNFLERNGRKGMFFYTSDHGEQLGERDIYAKKTLFDNAARVPLLGYGEGIKAGNVVTTPVSLVDIGITLCDINSAMIPYNTDGRSFRIALEGKDLPDSPVFSEYIENVEGRFVPAAMIRYENFKLIKYHEHPEATLLFNLNEDRYEHHNLSDEMPEKVAELEAMLDKVWNPEYIYRRHTERTEHIKILLKWGQTVHPEETERWHIPQSSLVKPELV